MCRQRPIPLDVLQKELPYKGRAILPSNDLFCEHFFPQAPSVPIVPAPAEKAAHNISWKNKPSCVTRTKRNGKEVFDHKCDNTSYDGWPTARAALLLSDHKFTGLSQVILVTRGCDNQ